MSTLLSILLALLIVATILAVALKSFVRIWLEYRLRMAFLQQLEKNTLSLDSPEAVESVLAKVTRTEPATERQDFLVTGALTVLFSVPLVVLGAYLRAGQIAIGTYYGGYICIAIGLLLIAFGAVTRLLARRGERAPLNRDL